MQRYLFRRGAAGFSCFRGATLGFSNAAMDFRQAPLGAVVVVNVHGDAPLAMDTKVSRTVRHVPQVLPRLPPLF
jgi:spore coat polysaccharide biosynthesis protein SpsF (cytidylyltransferase family)